VNPGVSDVQTESAELRRQHPGFCSRIRTAGVDVGASSRILPGRYLASVIESMIEAMSGERRLCMLESGGC
jgi:hypothetical protein